MEYIYFVIFSTVVGIAVLLIAHILSQKTPAVSYQRLENAEPAPPRKRTVSGKIETEVDVTDLQHRIDRWQRANAGRWYKFRQSADALKGNKYTFEAPKPRPVAKRVRPVRHVSLESSVGRRFELLN